MRAHLARANPQLRELAAVEECLVVFQGPQTYVSPSLYPTKQETGKVVPTWNYITVHAWGRPQVMDDAAWIRSQIDDLTRHKEAERAAPWQVTDAPEPFLAAQVKAHWALEIQSRASKANGKSARTRNAADQAGVANGLRGSGEEAMAAMVAERIKQPS